MLTAAFWIFGFLASMAVGAVIGAWFGDIGLIWGIVVGGYAFTSLRLWF
jgi:hypothetical protein